MNQSSSEREPGQWAGAATPLTDWILGTSRDAVVYLAVGAGLVLLMVWASVANLFTVRTWSEREIVDIKFAIGATRMRVLYESLAEIALLGAGAVVGAFALAYVMLAALKKATLGAIPRIETADLGPTTLVLIVTLVLATAVVCAVPSAVFLLKRGLTTSQAALRPSQRTVEQR